MDTVSFPIVITECAIKAVMTLWSYSTFFQAKPYRTTHNATISVFCHLLVYNMNIQHPPVFKKNNTFHWNIHFIKFQKKIQDHQRREVECIFIDEKDLEEIDSLKDEPVAQCGVCEQLFSTIVALTQHAGMHDDVEKSVGPWKKGYMRCYVCNDR